MTAITGLKRKEWEPVQVKLVEPLDLRNAALGPRGYKLKPVKSGKATLEKVLRAREQGQQQQPAAMEHDGDDAPAAAPAVKRQRAEGVPYRNVSRCRGPCGCVPACSAHGLRDTHAHAAAELTLLPARPSPGVWQGVEGRG